MIRYFHREKETAEGRQLTQYRSGAVGLIEQATKEDVQAMAKQLKLDVDDLVDIFDSQEIPRLEMLDGAALLFIRTPLPLENVSILETQLCMVALAGEKIWIISPGEAPYLNELVGSRNLTTTQPARVLLTLLMIVSKQYTHLTNEVSKKVDVARRQFYKAKEKDLEALLTYEVILNEYVSALAPMVQVCKTLVGSKRIKTSNQDSELIEDVLNDLGQTYETCLVNVKKIQVLRDSVQMIFTNRLNQSVQMLTAATIVLAIPTMFASLFGMNIKLPFQSHEQAFLIVLGVAGLISVAVIVWFRKKLVA